MMFVAVTSLALLGFLMGWIAGRITLRREMIRPIRELHAELDKVVAALQQRHDPNAVTNFMIDPKNDDWIGAKGTE